MSKNPPLKSAQNKPKTLGASVFSKYSNFTPKTETGSTRYNNLQSSANKLRQIKNIGDRPHILIRKAKHFQNQVGKIIK